MTGSGNWTYLLPGAAAVLIDAGTGQPAHLDALFARVPAGPEVVLVTHVHPDHASGAPAIAARASRASFFKYPWPEHDGAVGVKWTSLGDGQRVDTGDGPLEVVHTPGHSPDHVVFWHEASGTVFTGDLLVLGSTVVIPASHGGSLGDYLSSLARVAALRPKRALPAHGPAIDDPLALIAHYVTHRRHREAQILDALSAQEEPVAGIAGRIYRDLDPALLPQAHESVLAHLIKLEADGVAISRSGRWRRR
jgi:glyoxylase-like metal-dependent hydrolase (beta-lactamase superfamily II)